MRHVTKVDRVLFPIVIFCLVLLKTISSHAGVFNELIFMPSATNPAGQKTELMLYVHNEGEANIRYEAPDQIIFRIYGEDASWDVVARAVDIPSSRPFVITGNGFKKVRYVFEIPMNIEGPVRMEALDQNIPPVMFAVATAPDMTAETMDAKTAPPSGRYNSLDSLFSLYQPYLANIGAYKPINFLVGADPSKSRFQISLQYQLFNEDSSMSLEHPWLTGIRLGYTQTSIWNLKSASAPFEDTSYKPEVFFLSKNIAPRSQWFKGLFFQTGLQHESNGRGDEFSRSTNFYYFRPVVIFYNESSMIGLQIAPKVWGYFNNNEDTNPDLEDYRGYFELELKAGKAESVVFGSKIRWAAEGPSVQLDMTYPLDLLFFRNFDMYFQLQYVSSLAETLLNYHERTDAFRMGFAIVR